MKGGTAHLVVKGAAWVAVTRVLVSLIGLISTLVLARLLVPADFGLVAIAASIISMIMAVTELSLAQALIQKREPDDSDYDTAFTLNLLRAAGLAALIAAAAWPVAWAYGDDRLQAIMLVTAASTLFGGLLNPRMVVFQRSLDFRQEFVLSVSQRLVGLALAVPVAAVYHSYWALVVGSIATQASAILVSYMLVRYRPRLTIAKWRELMSFSVWLSLTMGVRTMNWRIDTIVAGYFVGPRLVGFYSMADNLSSFATRETVAPIAATMFPAYSRMADDRDRLRAAYRRASAMLCAVAFPAGIGFALVAESLIPLLLGAKWIEAVPMIQVLAPTVALSAMGWSMIPLASALGMTRSVFNREGAGLLIRIPFLLAGLWLGLATAMGPIMGLIWGRAVGTLLGTLVNMLLVRDLLDLPMFRQFADIGRVAAGCVVMAAVCVAITAVFGPHRGTLDLMMQSASVIVGGGLTFAVVTGALWVRAGRPVGPEAEFAELVARLAPWLVAGRQSV
jgi:O-antigen/teichoic acid export membrane protein